MPERELAKCLGQLLDGPHASEAVVLSTCLRTEVYAVVDRFHDGVADIESFFQSRLAGSPARQAELADRLVVAFDDAAAEHLFEVAAGTDSAVLGEGEILRQVRRAEERARAEQASGPVLSGLFRHALRAGKRVRAETGIARGVTSLSHVAVALAAERAGGLAGRSVLVVGAGEMGEGIVGALAADPALPTVTVANRSPLRAAQLAASVGARSIGLGALTDELASCDVVITAAATGDVLIGPEQVQQVAWRRGSRPLLLVDAAVPRNVDPAVAALPGVELADLDDLRERAEAAMAGRRAELGQARAIIAEELEQYRSRSLERGAAPIVSALRAHAERVRVSELERSRALFDALAPEQAAAVEALTRRIVAKLVHEPTVQVKRAAGSTRGERLAEAVRQLFGL